MKHLWRALKSEEVDRLTCQACQNRLPEYLLAETNQKTNLPQWRAMRLHLAICPVCSQARDELVELAEAGEGRPGLAPSFTPRPRLSFLSPRPESQAQAR